MHGCRSGVRVAATTTRDLLYWTLDTARVWECRASSGVTSPGGGLRASRISCRERSVRWFMIVGAVVMASLWMVWQQRYADSSPAGTAGGVGILVGLVISLARVVTYHNRWLCYRHLPVPRHRGSLSHD